MFQIDQFIQFLRKDCQIAKELKFKVSWLMHQQISCHHLVFYTYLGKESVNLSTLNILPDSKNIGDLKANFLNDIIVAWVRRTNIIKVIYINLHPCLKSFQMKNNFWNLVTKPADICKNAVLPEKKVRYWKKYAILKNWKKKFMDIRLRNWTYIKTIFLLKNHHTTFSSQN